MAEKNTKAEKTEKKQKFRNTIALKRNIYSVILSVIFIAAVIALTALSTGLAERYPLDIDLTTNKQHSISDNNFDYIKNVKEKINIYVTSTENAYNCSTGTTDDIGYIAATSQYVNYSSQNVVYYRQTVELLKKYADYNENITVSFIDVYDAKSAEITRGFEDFQWSIGDVLVEGKFELDGKEVVRRTVVNFAGLYTLEDTYNSVEALKSTALYYGVNYALYGTDSTGMGYGYFITENKVESAISSAIYKVTSPDTPVFLVPTAISNDKSVSDALEEILEINNFAVEYSDQLLSVLLTPENYDKYEGIILADCKSDITEAERQLIDDFLNNNGAKGKSLYYFAGINTNSLTNLCGLLGDWGIGFSEGLLYETDNRYHANGIPTKLMIESAGSEYTKTSDSIGKYCLANNIVHMKQLWPTSNTATYTRETTVILRTASNGFTTVMPLDADINAWTPEDGADKDKFITAIFARDDGVVDSSIVSSCVVAFAAADFIGTEYSTEYSTGNLNVVLDTFNEVTGNADTAFSFVPKTIITETYKDKVTENNVIVIRVIFMISIPIIVVSAGIVIWIRRKRK